MYFYSDYCPVFPTEFSETMALSGPPYCNVYTYVIGYFGYFFFFLVKMLSHSQYKLGFGHELLINEDPCHFVAILWLHQTDAAFFRQCIIHECQTDPAFFAGCMHAQIEELPKACSALLQVRKQLHLFFLQRNRPELKIDYWNNEK